MFLIKEDIKSGRLSLPVLSCPVGWPSCGLLSECVLASWLCGTVLSAVSLSACLWRASSLRWAISSWDKGLKHMCTQTGQIHARHLANCLFKMRDVVWQRSWNYKVDEHWVKSVRTSLYFYWSPLSPYLYYSVNIHATLHAALDTSSRRRSYEEDHLKAHQQYSYKYLWEMMMSTSGSHKKTLSLCEDGVKVWVC